LESNGEDDAPVIPVTEPTLEKHSGGKREIAKLSPSKGKERATLHQGSEKQKPGHIGNPGKGKSERQNPFFKMARTSRQKRRGKKRGKEKEIVFGAGGAVAAGGRSGQPFEGKEKPPRKLYRKGKKEHTGKGLRRGAKHQIRELNEEKGFRLKITLPSSGGQRSRKRLAGGKGLPKMGGEDSPVS